MGVRLCGVLGSLAQRNFSRMTSRKVVIGVLSAILIIVGAVMTLSWGWGVVYEEVLVEPYYLVAIDSRSEMMISRRGEGERVPPTVCSVGWSRSYIVAKSIDRHSRSERYFAIDLGKDLVLGPYSAAEFSKKRQELGLPQLSNGIELH